jgi:hypothetical protein
MMFCLRKTRTVSAGFCIFTKSNRKHKYDLRNWKVLISGLVGRYHLFPSHVLFNSNTFTWYVLRDGDSVDLTNTYPVYLRGLLDYYSRF